MRIVSFASHPALIAGVTLCAFAVALGCASTARAQAKYKELPADAKLSKWSAIGKTPSDERRVIESMLKDEGSYDEKVFADFFNKVVFPQFTRLENIYDKRAVKGSKDLKSTVCILPEMREDFKRLFLRDATNRHAHDRLNALTLNAMKWIAAENYHPIARYNAMLMIADLNEDEKSQTPYKPALTMLVYAASADKAIEGVRVAALIGVVRHAKAGVSANDAKLIASQLTPLVLDSKPPANRSREGHDWMRRRALEALAALYGQDPPADGSFLKLLETVLADKESTMELRAEAAEALLTVKIVPHANFDSAKMATGIGQVAVDAYRRELAEGPQLGRRKVYADGMKYYFALVDAALTALDKVAKSPKIGELQASLTELAESTELEEPDPNDPMADNLVTQQLTLYDKVAESGAKFEALVTGKPVSEILPKRGPVGGNVAAAAGGGYGGGYGGPGGYGGGRGGYGGAGGGYGRGGGASMDRGGYGRPAPVQRGGFGGAR